MAFFSNDRSSVSAGALLPHPNEVYVIGSSVGAGTGATGTVNTPANQGHMNRMGVLLTARGKTFSNLAVAGSNHTQQLAVLAGVLRRRPGVVLFQPSLGTTALDGAANEATRRYEANEFINFLKGIINACDQAGTQCIMCQVTPRGTSGAIGFSEQELPWALYVRDQLNRLNIPVFDHWALIDDGRGAFRTSPSATSDDFIHPNDAGYDIMYRAMDPTVIMLAAGGRKNYSFALGRRAAMRVADLGGAATFNPVTVRLHGSSPTNFGRYDLFCRSFSCFFRMRVPMGVDYGNKRIVCFAMSGNAILRVRMTSPGVVELVNNDGSVVITSSRNPLLDRVDCHIGVTLDHVTGNARLYIDGLFVGTGAIAGGANQTIDQFSIGSSSDGLAPPEGYIFSDVKFYGCLKDDEQALSIYTGDLDRGGLLVEMNGLPVMSTAEVENQADSGAGIQLNVRSVSPTWTRATTTATATLANHGLVVGQTIVVTVSSDTAAIVLGQKLVASVPSSSTFTFTCLNAGGASGTMTADLPLARPDPTDVRTSVEQYDGITDAPVATNGGTTTMQPRQEAVVIRPSGVIAAHTILLPETPGEGQDCLIACSGGGSVTALTLTAGSGHSLDTGATITTIAANGRASFKFRNLVWYRTG